MGLFQDNDKKRLEEAVKINNNFATITTVFNDILLIALNRLQSEGFKIVASNIAIFQGNKNYYVLLERVNNGRDG